MNTPVNTPSLDLVSIEAINGSIATVQIIGLDNKFDAIIPDGADVKVGEIYSIAMDYKHLIAGDNIPDEDVDKFERLQKMAEEVKHNKIKNLMEGNGINGLMYNNWVK